MTINLLRRVALSILAFGLASIVSERTVAAEKRTIDALSVWKAVGQLHRTGEKSAVFVGALQGDMYVETEEGPIKSGRIVCPGMLDLDLQKGAQTGEGRCVITAEDGAQVFARWTCAGYHMIGCAGDFTLTGGTNRFDGIAGKGPFTVRSELNVIAAGAGEDVAVEAAAGVAFWRAFTYEIP